jgi:hypothetical protein
MYISVEGCFVSVFGGPRTLGRVGVGLGEKDSVNTNRDCKLFEK